VTGQVLETDRLILRRWTRRDCAPFARLNGDPEVMAHFPAPLTRAESDATVARLVDRWAEDGIGFGVAERKADGAFLGMVGLARVRFAAPTLAGAVEVGWRLSREHWGQGYATEAARRWLDYGFEEMGVDEIVAFAVPDNLRSQAVMRRLGMNPDPARDFEHPSLPAGHPLRPHSVYALLRASRAPVNKEQIC
jgi:RimJ/RimL family protein N-acetyltransferase